MNVWVNLDTVGLTYYVQTGNERNQNMTSRVDKINKLQRSVLLI